MHLRVRSAFVVRPGRLLGLSLALTTLLLSISGCEHHRRSVLRPAFGTPVITAPATVVPDCPSGNCGGTVGYPASPPASTTVTPGIGAEPPLESITPSSTIVPELRPPSETRRPRGRALPRTALRDQVQPFVNDPNDLFGPPRADRPWKYVVLHHSATTNGSYAQIDRDHRQIGGFKDCGYHFVIGNGTESPDGQIEVAQRWSEQRGGAHCRDGKHPDVNEYGIGICLIGNFDQSPPTPRQIASAKALVAYLQDRYAIPTDHVGTHSALAHGHIDCPGRNFPTAAILNPTDSLSR